ncbi:MAG: hypothetical protein BEN18_01755 [Epulopiscium sp. Nuni2H_MBin001]|nr:MAG: hypothetical protein BEN18_01755 [Epulopiscium sp. Nuni2H_MBin001]
MTNNKKPPHNTYSLDEYRRIKQHNTTYSLRVTTRPKQPTNNIRKPPNKLPHKHANKHPNKHSNVTTIKQLNPTPIIIAVVASVLVIIVFRDIVATQTTISYQQVQAGTIDTSTLMEGIIIRRENVYDSTVTGNLHYITAEGQMVKKDGNVAVVADDSTIIQGGLNQLELSHISSAVQQLNTQDRTAVNELRESLDKLLINNAIDTFSYSQNSQAAYTIDNYHSLLTAPLAGIVSYKIDGYEDLTADVINYEMYTDLMDIIDGPQLSSTSATKGKAVYKIIDDYTWEIVSFIDAQEGWQYIEGNKYTLNIGNHSVTSTLSSKVDDSECVKLVFKIDESLSNYLGERKITFSVGNNSVEGLKIPIEAIVEKNVLMIPNEYIIRKDENDSTSPYGVYRYDGFVEIDIQAKDDDFTWVQQFIGDKSNIQLGDILIKRNSVDTYTVSNIQIIQGVYIINGGYANFKEIDVISDNGEYAVLGANSQLQRLDQIISNSKGVVENQLVKDMNILND